MRAGLSTIQQTLTPEAASVLTHSIAEAARRNHGQTTPLHVAATLLASPAGVLRQACIRSHPHSSHPLQCRALELCFSVALDRLPSTNPTPASPPAGEPPISNALMAALKRAQAHQRRGCPEQQQQPLLAVKVELEQLMISILDDPSVSRVMREASFSSTAVKAAVEQSISSSTNSSSSATATAVSSASPSPASTSPASPSPAGTLGLNLGLRGAPVAARNIYMYPRLHQHQLNGSNAPAAAAVGVGAEQPRTDEVKRVFDILLRSKKRNPVLVGDSDLDAVMREVLQKIESGSAPLPLRNAKVISCDKDLSTSATGDRSQIPTKIRELNSVIESNIGGERGVLLYLGDLKWLVESHGGASLGSGPAQSQQQQPKFSEVGRSAVSEMAKLVKAFEDRGKLWLLGTASCATYLRCQVYHQSMENDWDLQAVPIAPRSPLSHTIPRVAAGNGILSSSVGTLAPMKGYPSLGTTALLPQAPRPESANSVRKTSLCPVCMENYERELAKLVAKEFEKSSSKPESNKSLPQWLQLAKSDVKSSADNLKSKEQELMWKQSTEELLKRWNEICTRLHPNFHRAALGSEKPLVPNLLKPLSTCNPRLALEPKLTLSQSYATLRTKCNPETVMPKVSSEQQASPPASPVRTDLVLGSTKSSDSSPEKIHSDRVKDLTGCMQDELSGMQKAKIAGIFDIDSFKRLFKGLTEKVKWQQDAASTIATTVLKRKSGSLKRHNGVTKSDTWFLFIGPDSVGKRKMANALSELVSGSGLTAICFGDAQHPCGNAGESIRNFRGKTAMDQVVETIRRNPLSVILLEDIDQADGLVQGSIKRAMEKGRLPDSYGREVSLGSVIFIVTANWLPEELKNSFDAFIQCEEKILQSANTDWQLELSHGDQPGKRRLDWLCNVNKPNKLRKESSCGLGLSLDLNLAVGTDDDAGEGSRNSSDLTVDHEHGRLAIRSSMSTFVSELMGSVDSVIMFKPVDFAALKKTILESMSMKFTAVMGNQKSLKIDEDVLDHIAGGLWIGSSELDEWSETVIVPGLRQLKTNMKADRPGAIRLSVMKGEGEHRGSCRNLLPASVSIVVDGL